MCDIIGSTSTPPSHTYYLFTYLQDGEYFTFPQETLLNDLQSIRDQLKTRRAEFTSGSSSGEKATRDDQGQNAKGASSIRDGGVEALRKQGIPILVCIKLLQENLS